VTPCIVYYRESRLCSLFTAESQKQNYFQKTFYSGESRLCVLFTMGSRDSAYHLQLRVTVDSGESIGQTSHVSPKGRGDPALTIAEIRGLLEYLGAEAEAAQRAYAAPYQTTRNVNNLEAYTRSVSEAPE
jgi:hypothetical protein